MKRISVFCGSSPGAKPEYVQAAHQLGRVLADRGLGLVYGGASVGIMGEIARAVLGAGGEVVGVIPQALLDKEVGLTNLSDLRVVGSLHERKAVMEKLSDGFIAMPGGFGTFEEFFEVLAWAQLDLHHKPCGLLNVCQYYDRLVSFLDYVVEQQFVQSAHRSLILLDADPEALLDKFAAYHPPQVDKAAWILRINARVS